MEKQHQGEQPESANARKLDDSVLPEKRPSKIRVIDDDLDERLTTEEWRKRFAQNLDRLLDLLSLSRKDAADETGVAYPTVRRLVSAGISRTDDRSGDDTSKLVKFFCLESIDDLWRSELPARLLTTKHGSQFVKKFRTRLMTTRVAKLAERAEPAYDPLPLLNTALGFPNVGQSAASAPEHQKVQEVLRSRMGPQFRQLIEDYYEFISTSERSSNRKRVNE